MAPLLANERLPCLTVVCHVQEGEPVAGKKRGLRRLRGAIVGSAVRVFKAARFVVTAATRH